MNRTPPPFWKHFVNVVLLYHTLSRFATPSTNIFSFFYMLWKTYSLLLTSAFRCVSLGTEGNATATLSLCRPSSAAPDGVRPFTLNKIYHKRRFTHETLMNAWLNCGNSADVLMVYGIQCRMDDSGANSILNRGDNGSSSTDSTTYMGSGIEEGIAYVDHSGYFTLTFGTGGPPIITEQIGVLRVRANRTVEAY